VGTEVFPDDATTHPATRAPRLQYMPPFPYKTQPYDDKQREIIARSCDLPYAFLQMQQGTGKSYVTIITIARLWLTRKIDGVVILAPNGVHTAWALEQLPKHMPDCVPYTTWVWNSERERETRRKELKANKRARWSFYQWVTAQQLPILIVNSEAVPLALAKKAINIMLDNRKCFFAVDESGDFTKPNGKRTRPLMTWGPRAPYRRCLDGTPTSTSPFELYAPYRFLDWRILGYRTFQKMKDAHAEWEVHERGDNGRVFKVVKRDPHTGEKMYKDLDKLHQRIAPVTFRVLKSEMNLPEKQYHKRFFTLSKEQRRLTAELREQCIAELEGGGTVSTANPLTRDLRFQQIASGYVPPDIIYGEDPEPAHVIPGPNPRLELMIEEVRRHPKKMSAIVWARFQLDLDILKEAFREEGLSFCVYDGRTPRAEREELKQAFQAGKITWFLGNPKAGGRGLNLQVAEHMWYYTNYFGLRTRLQSEDRGSARIGGKDNTQITDILAERSIDMKIVRELRANMNVSNAVTGDPAKEWI
jgi:hypothetical protein